jgi:hypothetical protein
MESSHGMGYIHEVRGGGYLMKQYNIMESLINMYYEFQGRRGSNAESEHHMKRSQSVSQQLGG